MVRPNPACPADRPGASFDQREQFLLEGVAERLVQLGHRVGVESQEMLSLLDSGISIPDLLVLLASKGCRSG